MLNRVRILRLVVSFVNYLICLIGLYVFDFFDVIKISSFYKLIIVLIVSLVILFLGMALTYLKKNSNILYDAIYVVTFFIIIFGEYYTNKLHSDEALFVILFTVAFVAIFSHYLRIFEKKIRKVQEKDGDDQEICEVYSKYTKILAIFMVGVLLSFVLLSLMVYNLSSYLVMRFFSINIVFLIPAMIALVLLSLIGVFILMPERDVKK